MTDQKKASPDQKDPSPMDAERRRRMRETAERYLHRTGERGRLADMLWSALDALEQAERERDELRERLVEVERRTARLQELCEAPYEPRLR